MHEPYILHRMLMLVLGVASPLVATPAEEFDSAHQTMEMVPMRDGVRLATDVYRPAHGGKAAQGRFPVLIYRSPYNKSGNRNGALYFAEHGYVVVAQDCRGRFASEGDFYAFVNEGRDGYDTIEWAAVQPWSNGKVGTLGASYLAWDQYHAAMFRPPHLSAMFANVGGADLYREYAYPGGAPGLGWPIWILKSAQTSPQALQERTAAAALAAILEHPGSWFAQHPRERAEVFRKFPAQQRMYEDFYAHPDFDAGWKQRGFYTAGYYRQMKDVPIFFISGWYDYFIDGVLENFTVLSRIQRSMKKLWVGPWPHAIGEKSCGDADFGLDAAVRENELALEWFNHWLKGEDFRLIGSEPVRVFRMGGGGGGRTSAGKLNHSGDWLTLPAWPPANAWPSKYYIHDGGLLNASAPQEEKPVTYVFDPQRPVPTIGGRFGIGPWTPNCAQNQICSPKILGCTDSAPLKERSDVLSFSTSPLEAPIDVIGKVCAILWVSSDALDTDFTAKLMDVYPDAYALILADGQLRARYRKGFQKAELMKPGAVYRIEIDLGSVCSRFSAGHRIRLDLSSSNYPKFEPNPNTGEPPGEWTRHLKARNTVYHETRRASYLELPIVAAEQQR